MSFENRDPAKVIGDIYYEASQLFMLYHDWCKGRESISQQGWPSLQLRHPQWQSLVNHAALEKTLIHARNLIIFFTKTERNGKDDDILCVDFGYPVRSLQDLGISETIRVRINKSMAHLSYTRSQYTVELGTKQWYFHDFVPALLIESATFFTMLSQSSSPLLGDLSMDWIEAFIQQVKASQAMWHEYRKNGDQIAISPMATINSATNGL